MKQAELARQHAILKGLIKRAGHDPTTKQLEMLAHWGKYLCVLTAGFVENVVRLTYSAYVVKAGSKQTARYAQAEIAQIQNPKARRLVDIAKAFDPQWGSDLEVFLDDNFRGEAVDAIMSNRHQSAHGKNSGITLAQVDQYLTRIVEIAEFIETQCGI